MELGAAATEASEIPSGQKTLPGASGNVLSAHFPTQAGGQFIADKLVKWIAEGTASNLVLVAVA